MKLNKPIGLAAGLLSLVVSVSANAQTLVFCSEGSPEGFDPALYT
jgi:dipeptide transport system substrate-binding protein